MLCFRDATATSSMISQRTGSSGLSRFAFPYQRCLVISHARVGSRKSGSTRSSSARHPLARSVGQTTMARSGCSRSAPAKSSVRFSPSKSSTVSSERQCSTVADQPSVAAAIRTVAIAWPASCWPPTRSRPSSTPSHRMGTESCWGQAGRPPEARRRTADPADRVTRSAEGTRDRGTGSSWQRRVRRSSSGLFGSTKEDSGPRIRARTVSQRGKRHQRARHIALGRSLQPRQRSVR